MIQPCRDGHSGGVAITGMSCLFPGAPDVDAYWRNILGKVDATSDPPPEAWDPDVYYDPGFTDTDATYCKRGGYLGSLASFDPLAHGIPPVSVGGEPDQWLALRLAQAALEDAGAAELPRHVRERTGVILGKGTYLNGGNAIAVQRGLVVGQTLDVLRRLHPEYTEDEIEALRDEMERLLPPLGPETVPGLIPNIIVGRIANRLDLMGPAYTVDAACASSLVALQLAVRDLVTGECDLALAGGSQVWMPVPTLNLFCRLGALSRRQQLRAFDRDADGTLLGEGIGMVVLKRLADAERDGDRIYAVIRAVGVASDGRAVGVMAPRVEGEELALRRAYSEAGVSPRTVGLIEAHGTGTPVGDAAEISALTRVFGERNGRLPHCGLGSVKSMISHTIPAAGVASVIKVALALHHRVLPPTLHCDQPNPKLGLDRTPFYVNTETRPWIHAGAEPRRAGVNAFGFGGINAHAVLEEFDGGRSADHRPPWESELCVLESDSQAGLVGEAERLATFLDSTARPSLTDLAFTLSGAIGRADQPLRLAIVASSVDDLRAKLGQAIEKLRSPDCRGIKAVSGIYYSADPLARDGKVVFVFPGEGAQYPNMLADLCMQFSEVREVFDRIDRLYADHPRGYLLSDWVFPRPAFSDAERRHAEDRLMQLDIAVESVLTASGAVHTLLRRLIGAPDAMLGHSTGEHSAAIASGVLDVESDERLRAFCEGLHNSYAHAASRHDIPKAVLLALGADGARALEIAGEADGEIHLAMDNCPHQAVLVGEPAAIGRARQAAARDGIVAEELPYDRAVHTPLFAPFAEDLRGIFAELPVGPAHTELWSCTTAAPYPEDPAAIRELLVEHWTSPVRFRETIEALHEQGARVFVEVGPRGNMTSFIEDILRDRPCCAVAADVRRRSGVTQLNHLVGRLVVHDVDVKLGHLFAERLADEVDWDQRGADLDAKPKREVPLSTAWPMLRLSPEAAERLRPRTAAVMPSAGQPPANGHAPAPAPGPAPHAVLAAAPSIAPSALITAPTVLPLAADDDSAAVMDGHLRTMEHFLDAGAEIMQAFLGTPAPLVEAQNGFPLLGTIVAFEPGKELVARREVAPAEDRYLLDHTLGRTVSRTDPDLSALAVMPLAMSLELLAEAAACLVPGRLVIGMRDIRAYRWLSWDGVPEMLELRATHASESGVDRVHVELHTPEDDSTGGAPAVEADVLLGGAFPEPPAPIAPDLAEGRPCRFAPDRLYEDAMFHGESWRAVRSVDLVAPAGAHATLQALPRTGLLTRDPDPAFVLDPVVLDAAGQVVGFWAADRLERGKVVFPFRLAALDLYGPPPIAGETLSCLAAIELSGDALVRSDIDVLDASGRPLMRLAAWEDKRFDVPDRFRALTVPSAMPPMSAAWSEPVAPYDGHAVACRRLDARLPLDRGLWKPVWASRVLGRREREHFARLSVPEERQLEWLGARTAAKDATAGLLRAGYGLDLLPAEIEILPDANGAPLVDAPGLGDLDLTPVVSLSHAQGEAVAFAALAARGEPASIGIDIEPLRPLSPALVGAALRDDERSLLREVPAELADEWLLRCWCAKEAVGKALGSGLAPGRPEAPAVTAVDRDEQRVDVYAGGRQFVVHTRRDGDLVVATTLWTPGSAKGQA